MSTGIWLLKNLTLMFKVNGVGLFSSVCFQTFDVDVEGERCNECSCQCWRLQWVSSALGGHHTKVRNIVFWTKTKTKTKTKTTAQLLAATTLLVRCFCWMFLPSGMSWERGTWATSSRSAKQLPQRCSRGSTVRRLLGGFSLRELRWTTLSSI